jgi:prepilin-type processing-associated H-X9-DG protein
MLLPALKQARGAAKQGVCAGNLKQFGLMNSMYASDYEDYVLPARIQGAYWWWNTVLRDGDYGITVIYKGSPAVYSASGGVATCPSNQGRIGGYLVNYQINQNNGRQYASGAIDIAFKKRSAIKDQSGWWLFSDAPEVYTSSTYPHDIYPYNNKALMHPGNSPFFILHAKGGNIGYLDGHVQWGLPGDQ